MSELAVRHALTIMKLADVLRECAAQFRFYEAEHIKKGSLDKAETNRKFAVKCEEVVGQ